MILLLNINFLKEVHLGQNLTCLCFSIDIFVYIDIAFIVVNEYLCYFFLTQLGIIRTALPNMDREAKEEYHVVIQAKDMGGHMGGLSGTTKVTITLTDVNDNPPKFPQSK